MELSFSRGFSPGWLEGCDHKMLVPALSSAKHGVLRRARRARCAAIASKSSWPARSSAGDGVVFDGDRPQGEEQGGRVFEIFAQAVRSSRSRCARDRGSWRSVTARSTSAGLSVANNLENRRAATDAAAARVVSPATAPRAPRDPAVDLAVDSRGRPTPLSSTAARPATPACQTGIRRAAWPRRMRHPLTAEVLSEQFGRLGGTNYELGQLTRRHQRPADDPVERSRQAAARAGRRLDVGPRRRPTRGASPPRRRCSSAMPAAALGCADQSRQRFASRGCTCFAARSRSSKRRWPRRSQRDGRFSGHSPVCPGGRSRHAGRRRDSARHAAHSEAGRGRHLSRHARHGADGILARNLAGLDSLPQAGVPMRGRFFAQRRPMS